MIDYPKGKITLFFILLLIIYQYWDQLCSLFCMLKWEQSIMKLYNCSGICMEKLIVNNDILIVDETLPIRLFDLVVFTSENALFCHRCIFITKNRIVEYGENAKLPNVIDKGAVLGRCVGIFRGNKQYRFGPFSFKYYIYILKIAIFKFIWFRVIGLSNHNTKKYIKRLNKIKCGLTVMQQQYLIPV